MRQRVANGCKRKVTEDIFERPAKLMRREMPPEALRFLTEADITQIRKSIYKARAKDRPPLPTTLEELHRFFRCRPQSGLSLISAWAANWSISN